MANSEEDLWGTRDEDFWVQALVVKTSNEVNAEGSRSQKLSPLKKKGTNETVQSGSVTNVTAAVVLLVRSNWIHGDHRCRTWETQSTEVKRWQQTHCFCAHSFRFLEQFYFSLSLLLLLVHIVWQSSECLEEDVKCWGSEHKNKTGGNKKKVIVGGGVEDEKNMIKSLIRRMKWSGFSITASLSYNGHAAAY